jgi:putative PIN family toxin of toxin-antitoxin system
MRFLVALLKESELVEVATAIAECRDTRDNKFLELAVDGKADYIISGDEDLLVLHPFRGIPILTARDFLRATL